MTLRLLKNGTTMPHPVTSQAAASALFALVGPGVTVNHVSAINNAVAVNAALTNDVVTTNDVATTSAYTTNAAATNIDKWDNVGAHVVAVNVVAATTVAANAGTTDTVVLLHPPAELD